MSYINVHYECIQNKWNMMIIRWSCLLCVVQRDNCTFQSELYFLFKIESQANNHQLSSHNSSWTSCNLCFPGLPSLKE